MFIAQHTVNPAMINQWAAARFVIPPPEPVLSPPVSKPHCRTQVRIGARESEQRAAGASCSEPVVRLTLSPDQTGDPMLDRRQFLLTTAATAALASTTTTLAAAVTPAAQLDALFDSFMAADLDRSPENTTALGLDTGARAWEKARLDDRSLASIAGDKLRNTEQLNRLKALDRTSVSGMDQINYDVVMFGLQSEEVANARYDYGPGGAGAPYVISQLTGAYSAIPDFLDSQHQIVTKVDADDYLARLGGFATALDQEVEVVRHDAKLGCIPPDFALGKTLDQMTKLRASAPADAVLVTSVARRAKEKNIPGDYAGDAAKIVADKVYPALDRQIALVKELQTQATHDAGVWKLPAGDKYYADSLIFWTTSPLSPEEIHKMGLDVVGQYSARIDAIMKSRGMTKGTVGERLRAMYDDPQFRYPNTDEGKEKLLADLNVKVKTVRAKLPQYFGTLPKADVIIKRVPKYTEAAAPGGYYQPPSLDGTRPGTYYINLRDTAEVPSWTLPTLTFHESIPGHHLQGSIAQEATLPLIRKISFFSAYLEGWALYAEQLTDEMGMYDDDPFGRIGYLHDAMFRGVRLVVDTGMHAMRWSREKAIAYYTDTLGDPVASATTEVERYCVWPGQACSYMLGKLTILRLRDKAKAALGPRFDLRKFHDAILLCGAVPLTVLETVVDAYIRANRT
jgi:uncharacterized protein (DUF885 family)